MVAIGVPAEIWRVALALSKHYPPGARGERGKDELGLRRRGSESSCSRSKGCGSGSTSTKRALSTVNG